MNWKHFTLLLCAAVALTAAQEKEIQEIEKKLKEANIDLSGVNVEEAEKAFKEKCLKEADIDAFNKVNAAKDDLQKCVENLFDFQKIQEEVEKAKPTGDLDLVFKKYCGRSPQFKNCIKNFTSVVELCLNEKERENIKVVMNITDSLLNFVCYKEGDRIALFIAEGGPECLTEKSQAIENCLNSSLTKYIPSETPSLDNLPELIIKTEQCDEMNKLQTCIVNSLESCKEPTPANIAESLFKFIKQVTPCGKNEPKIGKQQQPPQADSKSAATTVLSSIVLVVTAAYFA